MQTSLKSRQIKPNYKRSVSYCKQDIFMHQRTFLLGQQTFTKSLYVSVVTPS